jgi:adenylate cyclase
VIEGLTSQNPRSTVRRITFLCGLAPTIFIAVLALYRPSFVARFDNGVYDLLLRWCHTKPPSGRVVIVDVDERSLSTIGQWPWRRDLVGRLIANLRDLGAATVALDIVFAERDRWDDSRAEAEPKVAEAFRPANAGLKPRATLSKPPPATPDSALAETLRRGRVILGYAMTFDNPASTPGVCVLHPIGLAVQSREESDTAFFHATGAVCNLPELSQAAGASGFLNAAPDPDGILRRVPLVIQLDGRTYPGLGLAAVAAVTGARYTALHVWNINAASLTLDDRIVPVDGKSNLLVRYRGRKRTFPYLSAADVLTGQLPAGSLKDKIVFVGTTALGTREVVATPLDTLFAGVEVHATVADNLLQKDFIRRHAVGAALESQITLAMGVALSLIVARWGLLLGTIAGAGTFASLWWATLSLLSANGLFVSPLFPSVCIVSALAVMTRARVTIERRRADLAGEEKSTAQRLMVQSLLSLTEVRDPETGRHSRRTQSYAKLLARQLATHPRFRDYLTPERIDLLSSLAPLHDIGKVGVPDRILNKPGALTPEELAEMRKHPVHGRDVILKAEEQAGVRDDTILTLAKDIVYTHHERWDGTGYPEGLSGTDIPIPGRVMALVDVYDAAVTRNVYRRSRTHDDTVQFIVSCKGTHFDPAVVEAFVDVAPEFEKIFHEDEAQGHLGGGS